MDTSVRIDMTHVARFKDFHQKRLVWLSWLNGDDPHSIWKQISSALWDYVLFLTLNDLRNNEVQNQVEGIRLNIPLLRLLDAGFVATQVMGIRRVVDKRSDVISLKRLVDDIDRNRTLITRRLILPVENYLTILLCSKMST